MVVKRKPRVRKGEWEEGAQTQNTILMGHIVEIRAEITKLWNEITAINEYHKNVIKRAEELKAIDYLKEREDTSVQPPELEPGPESETQPPEGVQ